jgi:hypothetical protein
MQRMEAPDRYPVLDPHAGEAELAQLAARNRPVLAARQRPELPHRLVDCASHGM